MNKGRGAGIGVFKIASAYIGTVVGAGFASGQEILQFFCAFGAAGLAGILIASLLFFYIGYSILALGRNLHAASHIDVVRHTNGLLIGSFIDIVITVFLFGGLAAMIAGAGAIFIEQFAVPAVWGTLVMAIIALLTVATGTKGVITAISYVVPFLIAAVLAVSIVSLTHSPITADKLRAAAAMDGATPNWLLSAVNYASYNIVISIGVLTPMGTAAADRKKLFWGALLGAVGLAVGMAAIYLCLLANIQKIGGMQVPMVEIAGTLSAPFKIGFAIVLFAEVYTTAVGNLYGLSRRIARRLSGPWTVPVLTILAFLVGQLGFSNMVKYLYPAVGYGGILFFAGVIWTWLTKRDSLR